MTLFDLTLIEPINPWLIEFERVDTQSESKTIVFHVLTSTWWHLFVGLHGVKNNRRFPIFIDPIELVRRKCIIWSCVDFGAKYWILPFYACSHAHSHIHTHLFINTLASLFYPFMPAGTYTCTYTCSHEYWVRKERDWYILLLCIRHESGKGQLLANAKELLCF